MALTDLGKSISMVTNILVSPATDRYIQISPSCLAGLLGDK